MIKRWQCFVVTLDPKTHAFRDARGREWLNEAVLPVGAMWIGANSDIWGIKLPGESGRNRFCPSLEYAGHRWEVGGQPPYITVTTVIKLGQYHGWIQDGFVTEDIDGRKFNEFGIRML